MRKRASSTDPAAVDVSGKRMLSLSEGCSYSGLGRTSFRHFADAAGATRKFGKRTLFDRFALDKAFDSGVHDLKEITPGK